MTRRLFVDCETSDLLKKNLPLSDQQQPWICSMAAELCEADGTAIDYFVRRVRADGRKIKAGAEATHGISSRNAGSFGASEIVVLGMISSMIADAQYVIGHGLVEFDSKIIEGVLVRKNKDPRLWSRPGLELVDTMIAATPFCKLVHRPERDDGQYKYPSLDQACEILLGEAHRVGPHDPWVDMQRCKRLYYKLLDLGAFEVAA